MKRFHVRFKNNFSTAFTSCDITAADEAAAMLEAAQMLGMDTDPLTQTYSLMLEVIPSKPQPVEPPTKNAIKTYQFIRTQQQARPVDACTDAAQLHGLTTAALAAALIAAGIDAARLSLI
jgi:hypothetical protein